MFLLLNIKKIIFFHYERKDPLSPTWMVKQKFTRLGFLKPRNGKFLFQNIGVLTSHPCFYAYLSASNGTRTSSCYSCRWGVETGDQSNKFVIWPSTVSRYKFTNISSPSKFYCKKKSFYRSFFFSKPASYEHSCKTSLYTIQGFCGLIYCWSVKTIQIRVSCFHVCVSQHLGYLFSCHVITL